MRELRGERREQRERAVLAPQHALPQRRGLGIERIDAGFAPRLFAALQAAMERGATDAYYEDVYSELIAAGAVTARAVDVSDLRWSEIDTLEDLEAARVLFAHA